jgi:hypothetical protein
MVENDHYMTTELFYRLAELFHITRFMMGQSPSAAELFCSSESREKVGEAVDRGNGVILQVSPGDPPSYIVIRNGTRYTTSTRPKWARDDDIQILESTDPKPKLLPALQAACRTAESLSPEAYRRLNIDKILTSISWYYSNELPTAVGARIKVSEALAEINFPSLSSSNEEALKWIKSCQEKLIKGYHGFLLAGDTIVPSLSTLFFLEWAPLPAIDILGDDIKRSGAATLLQDLKRGHQARVSILPSLNLELCIVYLELHHEEGAALSTISAAAVLMRLAERSLENARAQTSFELFHNGLFGSLIYYRLAQFVLNSLLSLEAKIQNGIIGSSDLEKEARRLAYMCEEMRVQIMVSLASFHIAGLPRLGEAGQFWEWLTGLEELEISDARSEITNLSIQLLLPDFLQALAKDWLRLKRPETFDLAYPRLLQTAQQIEAALPRNVVIGEPNYLSFLYIEIASQLEKQGRIKEADDLRWKADTTFFQAQLDKHNWTDTKSNESATSENQTETGAR